MFWDDVMSENIEVKTFSNPSHYINIFNKDDEKYYNYLALNNMNKENQSKKEFLYNNPIIKPPDYANVTVIIPFHDSNDPKRIENLEIVLKHLKLIGVEHIIISEEDEYSKLNVYADSWSKDFKDFLLLFTPSNDLFNKSAAVNEGVKRAITSNVVMMDSDVLIEKCVFDKSLSLLDSFFDFVYPFNRMVQQIYSIGEGVEKFNFDDIGSEIEIRPNADGGCLFCRKQSLLNIGGFNQRYKGWGGEDNEITLRINLSDYKCIRLNNILYHLHHTKKKRNGSNANILLESSNLSRFNDINILINENRDMYLNSRVFKEEHFKSVTGYLISVIIPIYKCDSYYLDRCITSLKNQTLGFENIEVILVDNDCNEESINLINSYVEKYDNFKPIFLDSNSSISVARNEGIKLATADNVIFLDSDDYFVRDICEIAYNNINKENADIIVANYINLDNVYSTNWESLIKLKNYKKCIGNYNEYMNIFLIPPSIGTKTYNKEFLLKKNLFFKDYSGGEDLVFNQETLFNASTIVLIDTPALVYSYERNENKDMMSMTLDYDKDTLISFINALEESYNLFNVNAPKFTYIALNNLNNFFNKILFKSNLSFDEFKEISANIRLIATNYLYNDKAYKSQNCINLIELIINGELTKAYENYLELI